MDARRQTDYRVEAVAHHGHVFQCIDCRIVGGKQGQQSLGLLIAAGGFV
ncbi:MAG: hypothetical protein AAF320_05780 [Myxococcota bacterium]